MERIFSHRLDGTYFPISRYRIGLREQVDHLNCGKELNKTCCFGMKAIWGYHFVLNNAINKPDCVKHGM